MKRNVSLLVLLIVASLVTGCFGLFGSDPDTYSVTVNFDKDMGNVVLPDNIDEIEDGTKITLKAEPKEGYEFVNWTGEGVPANSTNPELEIVVESDMEITANFREEGLVTLTVKWDNDMGDVELPESLNVAPGTEITLVAKPANNHGFVEWLGEGVPAGSTDPTLTIKVEADMEVEAVFMELLVEDFETYALGHEFRTLGWYEQGVASVVEDPLDENNKVMRMEIHGYNNGPFVPITIPEGKTLADYDTFVFEGYFASGNVVNQTIGVSVYKEHNWVFEMDAGNSIGQGSRAEENRGSFSTEWETITIEISNATNPTKDWDGDIIAEPVILSDMTGDIFVSFSMHTTPVTEKDENDEDIVIEQSVFYADNIRFE